jgi:hypothetical protein
VQPPPDSEHIERLPNPIEVEVNWGTKKPGEHLPFEHRFDPEGAMPPPMF